jgi:TonB family protein
VIAATILLVVALLVVPRFRGSSAAQRHALWAGALVAAAAAPGLGALSSPWRPEWIAQMSRDVPAAIALLAGWPPPDRVDIVVRATGLEPQAWAMRPMLFDLWVAGTALAMLRLVLGLWRLACLTSRAGRVDDETAVRLATEAARSLGVSTPVLLRSRRTATPFTWGIRPPRVVVPATADAWDEERWRVVLMHELAHVRRQDWIVHLSVELICSLYWIHPLFWLARGRLRREAEAAADDIVLGQGISGHRYAAQLLSVARESAAACHWVATPAMARAPLLRERVERLLASGQDRRPARRATAALCAACLSVAGIVVSAAGGGRSLAQVDLRPAGPQIFESSPQAVSASMPNPVFALRLPAPPVAAGVVPPRVAVHAFPALYSDEARRARLEGLVTVHARVDEVGSIVESRVVRGLGHGLDQNALLALRRWRFEPGTRAGRPEAMDVEIDIEFSLRHEAINALIANDMATTVGPGVTPPRLVSAEAPRGSGRVLLDFVLQEDGTPRVVRVLRSSNPSTDDLVARSLERWRFTPARRDGRPVKVRMTAEVTLHG